jgi:polygalacturonase
MQSITVAGLVSAAANNTAAINRALATAVDGDTVLVPMSLNFHILGACRCFHAPLCLSDLSAIINDSSAPSSSNCITLSRSETTSDLRRCQSIDIFFRGLVTLGGVTATNKSGLTLAIEGNLTALPDFTRWPLQAHSTWAGRQQEQETTALGGNKNGAYAHIIHLVGCTRLVVTGSGTIDGQGAAWWARYVVGPCGSDPLPHNSSECHHRPKALVIEMSSNVLLENITSLNSPSFNFDLAQVSR